MTLRRSFVLLATRRRVAAVVLVLLPLLAVAARTADGESSADWLGGPTGRRPPSGVANISGAWTGTSRWQEPDADTTTSVTMSIEQHDRTVTGTVAYTSAAYQEWSGTISGIVAGTAPDTQFVGTIELQAPPAAGTGTCSGTAVFSGRSVSNALRWDTSQLTVTPNTRAAACRERLRNVVLTMGRG